MRDLKSLQTPSPFLGEGGGEGGVALDRALSLSIPQEGGGKLETWDKKYLWHPFTPHTEWAGRKPIIIESGRGVWLRDIHGRKFLDGNSSLWVNVWGHRFPELDRAIRQQLGKIAHSTFLGLTHEPAIRLAKKLIEIAPSGLSRVFYSDNGSTAVEVALKMAYQYWQLTGHPKKTKFVSLKEGYHGDTIGSVSVGGVELFHERFKGLLFEGWQVTAPHPPFGHPLPKGRGPTTMQSVGSPVLWRLADRPDEGAFENITRVINRHHASIAAVIMEPLVQGASGMRLLPRGYLAHVAKLCRGRDVLLIVDEVATGFGRTGTMFACEQERVSPDFLCVAKSLTGGYLPLAATLTKERIYRAFLGRYDEFKAFFHGHTYTANPLACAVALKILNLYENKRLLRNIRRGIFQMAENFNRLKFHSLIKEIRQVGLMAGIELGRKTHLRPQAEHLKPQRSLRSNMFGLRSAVPLPILPVPEWA